MCFKSGAPCVVLAAGSYDATMHQLAAHPGSASRYQHGWALAWRDGFKGLSDHGVPAATSTMASLAPPAPHSGRVGGHACSQYNLRSYVSVEGAKRQP